MRDSTVVQEMLAEAAIAYRSRRIQAAEQLLKKILSVAPRNHQGLNLLAKIYLEQGLNFEAAEFASRAIDIAPTSPSYHNTKGKALARAGDHEKALRSYQDALDIDGEFAPALFNLAMLEKARGNPSKAVKYLRKTVKVSPAHAAAHNNLGNILREMGNGKGAEECYRTFLELRPDSPEAYGNIASMELLRGAKSEAERGYQAALRLNPAYSPAIQGLAQISRARGDVGQAGEYYRKLVESALANTQYMLEYAHFLKKTGDLRGAKSCFRRIIQIEPKAANVYNDLGGILLLEHATDEALQCFNQAVELDGNCIEALFNVGLVLGRGQERHRAVAYFEKALKLGARNSTQVLYYLAHLRMSLCDWSDYDELVASIIAETERALEADSEYDLPPWTLSAFPVSAELRERVATHHSMIVEQFVKTGGRELSESSHHRDSERIRIAYVSADFRKHAVGYLIQHLFSNHDASRFEVFCYSLINEDDEVARRIREGCEHFVDISNVPSFEAAQLIRDDGIQVLIDLSGFTTYSRPEILAYRPAPVQIHYLGHLDTLGAPWLSYTVADRYCLSNELRAFYSESIAYLPDCFMVAGQMDEAERVPSRAESGLPEEAVVFCNFNAPYKIDPRVFELWMSILARVPESVLWLFADESKPVEENLRVAARGMGIDPARLVFAPRVPNAEHLARCQLADLFLDTLVYNGGATAIGAIWSGLPVLTLPGSSVLSRMGASICAAAGLENLICANEQEYREKAVVLATNRHQLAALKTGLRENRGKSALFDTARWVKHFEQALGEIWRMRSKKQANADIWIEK